MVPSLLAAVSLALLGQAAPQPAVTGNDLVLSLYVRVARGGGEASAGDHGTGLVESHVWADAGLCSLGASDFGFRSTPAFGWVLRGRILQQAGDEALVEIDWRRRFSIGVELAAGPQGTMQIAMRRGDRLVLDEVEATDSRCGAGIARVEAGLSPFAETIVVTPRKATASGTIGGGGRGAAGWGSSPAGVAAGAGSASDASHLAHLWLVQTRPDGSEHVQMQTTAVGRLERRFSFPPVRVPSGDGELSVVVSGLVRVASTSDGRARIAVTLAREVRDAQGRRLADGGASRTVDLPLGDVVMFELPRQLDRAHPTDNRFAVRLRLSDFTRARDR